MAISPCRRNRVSASIWTKESWRGTASASAAVPVRARRSVLRLVAPVGSGRLTRPLGAVPTIEENGTMRIAIIGAGNVGGTLGKGWAKKGHDVFFGVRNPTDDKTRQLVQAIGSKAQARTVGEAAAFG